MDKLSIALTVLQLGGNVTDPKLKKAAEKIILGTLEHEPSLTPVEKVKKPKKKSTEPKGEDNGNV